MSKFIIRNIKPTAQKPQPPKVFVVNEPMKIKNPPKETQPPRCAVKSCKSKSNELFVSPEDPVKLRKWREAVGTHEAEFYVCEIHFTKGDLIVEKNLEDDAVPKLYLNVINYWKPDCCGICLEKLRTTEIVYAMTPLFNETFEELTGYRPSSDHVCHECKFVLTMLSDFKKKIQVMHDIARKGRTIIKTVPQRDKVEEPMIVDSDDNEERFQCDDCPFICDDDETLGKHIISAHVNGTVNAKTFTKEYKPPRYFSGPQKVICFYCKKEFDTDEQLKHHEAKAHGKNYKKIPIGVPIRITDPKLKSALRIENSFELPKRTKRKNNPENLTDDEYEFFEINELTEDDDSIEMIDYEPRTVEQVTLLQNQTLDLKDENEEEATVKISILPESKKSSITKVTPGVIEQKPPEKKLSLYELKKLRIEKALPEIQMDNHKYKCLECQDVSKSSASFIKHRFEVHPEKEERNKIILEKLGIKIKCEFCDEKLYEVYMQDHIWKIHESKATIDRDNFKDPLYECDLCGKKFSTRTEITNHLEGDHNNALNDELKCEICWKKFYTKEKLDKHKETLHKNGFDCGARCNAETNAFKCGNCNRVFFCLKAMRTHGCVETT